MYFKVPVFLYVYVKKWSNFLCMLFLKFVLIFIILKSTNTLSLFWKCDVIEIGYASLTELLSFKLENLKPYILIKIKSIFFGGANSKKNVQQRIEDQAVSTAPLTFTISSIIVANQTWMHPTWLFIYIVHDGIVLGWSFICFRHDVMKSCLLVRNRRSPITRSPQRQKHLVSFKVACYSVKLSHSLQSFFQIIE